MMIIDELLGMLPGDGKPQWTSSGEFHFGEENPVSVLLDGVPLCPWCCSQLGTTAATPMCDGEPESALGKLRIQRPGGVTPKPGAIFCCENCGGLSELHESQHGLCWRPVPRGSVIRQHPNVIALTQHIRAQILAKKASARLEPKLN